MWWIIKLQNSDGKELTIILAFLTILSIELFKIFLSPPIQIPGLAPGSEFGGTIFHSKMLKLLCQYQSLTYIVHNVYL